MLIKDPEVNIMSVIAKNPKVTSAWDKSVVIKLKIAFKQLFIIIVFNFFIKNNAKAKTAAAAALPQKPVVTQPITVVATSKLTSTPCKSKQLKRETHLQNLMFISFQRLLLL